VGAHCILACGYRSGGGTIPTTGEKLSTLHNLCRGSLSGRDNLYPDDGASNILYHVYCLTVYEIGANPRSEKKGSGNLLKRKFKNKVFKGGYLWIF
jgi:hypothetical protein